MRKLLIAAHGAFAEGLKQMMEFVLGKNDSVYALNAYTSPDFHMEREASAWTDSLQDGDELIVLTDVLGGSVANAFSERISQPGIYVLAGVSAPMLFAIAPLLNSDMSTEDLIKQGLHSAREGCVYINDRLSRIAGEKEEDFDD